MSAYHINYEGRVSPCKAKIRTCPYGTAFHSESEIHLYEKLIETGRIDSGPSPAGLKEVNENNRLLSLYCLSDDIARVDHPLDVIIATLYEAIKHIQSPEVKADMEKWRTFEHEVSEHVKFAYAFGQKDFPEWIPAKIRQLGSNKFYNQYNGEPISKNPRAERKRRYERMAALEIRMRDYQEYEKHERRLTIANYEYTRTWMTDAFNQFAHDRNTSRLITQPTFYGDIEKAKTVIANLTDYEILNLFDDYSITDQEIEEAVKKANFFEYKNRIDLSDEANTALKTWYHRNRTIYFRWKVATKERVVLAMIATEEIDRRGLIRPDRAIGQMLAGANWL